MSERSKRFWTGQVQLINKFVERKARFIEMASKYLSIKDGHLVRNFGAMHRMYLHSPDVLLLHAMLHRTEPRVRQVVKEKIEQILNAAIAKKDTS